MKILSIVWIDLIRTARDRTALFFTVLLPLILILVLGLTYGSGTSARIGVFDADGGTAASSLVDGLGRSSNLRIDLRRFDSLDALREAASRGIVEAGLAIPAGYTDALASGKTASVTIVVPPTPAARAVSTTVEQAVARQVGLVRAARLAAPSGNFEQAYVAAEQLAEHVAGVSVDVVPVNASTTAPGGFDQGAQSQLILFMFLTSLTGATELVLTRQLGISRRMYATPTSIGTIVAGESLARIAMALVQGAFIVIASTLLFGIHWGNPLGVAALVTAFALVAGGASMVLATIASNPSQVGASGAAIAMLMGLLGGAMVPLDVFSDTMRRVAHVTPHAWALDGLRFVSEPGAGVGSALTPIAVLLGFAVVCFGVGIFRFRRVVQGVS